MKKMMFLVLMATFLMTTSAFACDGGGNQCFEGFQEFNIAGLANFGGGFAATFEGDEGYAMGEKSGYGGIDLTLSGAGDGCGSECSDVGWTFEGLAGEHVMSSAGALTTSPGGVAAAINEGAAFSSIGLMFGPAQQ